MAKRSSTGTLLRAVLAVVLACILASVGAVVLFRFVPVPVSALMVERRIASWFSDKPYRARHRWASRRSRANTMAGDQ